MVMAAKSCADLMNAQMEEDQTRKSPNDSAAKRGQLTDHVIAILTTSHGSVLQETNRTRTLRLASPLYSTLR